MAIEILAGCAGGVLVLAAIALSCHGYFQARSTSFNLQMKDVMLQAPEIFRRAAAFRACHDH
ncbi:MAG: hypothetical protein ABL973_11435 [Micropepsaceae bacterium]